jgi:hypothetical protein
MIPATSTWKALAQAGSGGAAPLPVAFQIAGYPRIFCTAATGLPNFYPWISAGNAGSLTMSVNDLEGGSNVGDLSFTVMDVNRQLTQDFQGGANLMGQVCTLMVGFPNLPQAQWITLMTLVVDHIDLANQNTGYKFTLRDNSTLMQQYSWQVADDGYPTSTGHIATVKMDPMTAVYEAVIQSGLPPANINNAALINLRDTVYFGFNVYFQITYPPRAKDWIEQEIFKPLGAYWFWNYLGQLTPYSMLPYAPPVPVMDLNETNIDMQTPPVPMRSSDYTAVIIYKIDGDSNGQNFQTIIVSEFAPAVNLYGIAQSKIIQSRGVRSSIGGGRMAYLTTQNVFSRYGLKPLTYKPRCFLPAMLLEIGDKVTLSHPLVPNALWASQFRNAGTMGITGTLWEVKGKTVDLNDGSVQLDLLDVSWQLINPGFYIAPNGTGPYSVDNQGRATSYMYYSSAGESVIGTSPASISALTTDATYENGDTARLLF